MIRMINGVTCIGGRLLDTNSGPFAADPVTEANLVRRGAAEYCDVVLPSEDDGAEVPGVTDEAGEVLPDEASEVSGESAETADLDAMSAAQLREMCDERGIAYKKNASAKALRALLEADAEDGIMPELTAADPVDA